MRRDDCVGVFIAENGWTMLRHRVLILKMVSDNGLSVGMHRISGTDGQP